MAYLLGDDFNNLDLSMDVKNHHAALYLLKEWSANFFPGDDTLVLSGDGTFVPNGGGTGGGTVTSIGLVSSTLTISNSPITTAGDIEAELSASGVTPGTYNSANVTVDTYGRITSIVDGTPNTITLTGDVTGSGTTSIVTTLVDSGVLPGTYTNSTVTFDSKGRATFAASGTSPVTSVGLLDASTNPIYIISGSPVTSTGTLTFTLGTQNANRVFAGPTSGSAAQPTFRSLTLADLPTGLATVTSVNASGGTTGMSFTGGPITTSGTLVLTGTLGTGSGGTGLTGIGTPHQLLGVNDAGTGLIYNTIAAGTGITITASGGVITINNGSVANFVPGTNVTFTTNVLDNTKIDINAVPTGNNNNIQYNVGGDVTIDPAIGVFGGTDDFNFLHTNNVAGWSVKLGPAGSYTTTPTVKLGVDAVNQGTGTYQPMVQIIAPDGTTTGGSPGTTGTSILIKSGDTPAGAGSSITGGATLIYAGDSLGATTAAGGTVVIKGGEAQHSTGKGGAVYIQGGQGHSGSGTATTDGGVAIWSGFYDTTGLVARLHINSYGAWRLAGLPGTSGQVLTSQGGTSPPLWTTVGSGTVSSVAMTVPSFMSVSGSPITSSGTLAVTANSNNKNRFLATPSNTSGSPTMREIIAVDVIQTNYSTPGTGSTLLVQNPTGSPIINNIVNPTGTIATLTINFPATPNHGQICKFAFKQIITTLTMSGNGNTLDAGLTTAALNQFAEWTYESTTTTWYRTA